MTIWKEFRDNDAGTDDRRSRWVRANRQKGRRTRGQPGEFTSQIVIGGDRVVEADIGAVAAAERLGFDLALGVTESTCLAAVATCSSSRRRRRGHPLFVVVILGLVLRIAAFNLFKLIRYMRPEIRSSGRSKLSSNGRRRRHRSMMVRSFVAMGATTRPNRWQ